VTLAWSFNDGNAGAQGSGGALAASGSSTVNITAQENILTTTEMFMKEILRIMNITVKEN
jgi:hypothetical protein